jgi:hypothetical protein
MRQTAIQEIIQEFNKELEVSTQIGNEDKIRIIKHLINISTKYLPTEKTNIKDAFEMGEICWKENQNITSEDYYQLNFSGVKRIYSEEEVLELLLNRPGPYLSDDEIKEWFQQHKK